MIREGGAGRRKKKGRNFPNVWGSVVLGERARSHLVHVFVELNLYFNNVPCILFTGVRNLVAFNPCALAWLQLDVHALQN